MSFSGDLEHLPIVDVIQLLHSTRKTGTLCLRSNKGESQLVFNDGLIVSANHVNNSVRIGQVLMELKAITREDLDQALLLQKTAGPDRKPLIATLIEGGRLRSEDAYTGLETLIEMTIVEVLTWTAGTFALDVDTTVVSDEYRYFPDTLKQEIYLNTQSILMDSLRIYDERMRDGSLSHGVFSAEGGPEEETGAPGGDGRAITADLLGLDDLESLTKKIPDVFTGLKEHDQTGTHRRKIREAMPDMAPADHERLLASLMAYAETPASRTEAAQSGRPRLMVMVFSRDPFLSHLVTTVCKHDGVAAFATDDEENIGLIVNQSLSRGCAPLLVMDAPEGDGAPLSAANILALQQRNLEAYPQLAILQLVAPRDYEFPLRALQNGAKKVLCRPVAGEDGTTFVEESGRFLAELQQTLKQLGHTSDNLVLQRFKECIFELGTLMEVPDVVFIPLRFASSLFERCLTLVVGTSELIAEKSFGIAADKGAGPSPPLLFKLPLAEPSVLTDVIKSGAYFYNQCSDDILKTRLHTQIGAPSDARILLIPIKNFGRVIAVIYADFGAKAVSPVQIDLLDIVVRHTGLVLDNNLYRKRFEKP